MPSSGRDDTPNPAPADSHEVTASAENARTTARYAGHLQFGKPKPSQYQACARPRVGYRLQWTRVLKEVLPTRESHLPNRLVRSQDFLREIGRGGPLYRFHHWRVQIEDARDERAIIDVIRNYRRTLTPAMGASLPAECREALEKGDISAAALKCLEAEMKSQGSPELTALLHEVAQTYAAAAVKVLGLKSPR